jgi:hypothetical protein
VGVGGRGDSAEQLILDGRIGDDLPTCPGVSAVMSGALNKFNSRSSPSSSANDEGAVAEEGDQAAELEAFRFRFHTVRDNFNVGLIGDEDGGGDESLRAEIRRDLVVQQPGRWVSFADRKCPPLRSPLWKHQQGVGASHALLLHMPCCFTCPAVSHAALMLPHMPFFC